MNTPDTEVDAYSRGYKQGRFDSEMDRLNEEKPTPDTEDWEKEFDEKFDWIDEYISDKPTYDHYNDIKTFITNLRTSRDTYWKERVRNEQRKHNCPPDDGDDYDQGAWEACEAILDNLK